MNIPNQAKDLIIEEIKIAVNMMRESQEASEKLFYFSAISGILQRVYNIEYDEDLVFAHFIISSTHQGFLQRLSAIRQGGDRTIILSDEQLDKLTVLAEELSEKIKKNEDIIDALKKFVVLLYSTQGNGYYLMKKGVLKI